MDKPAAARPVREPEDRRTFLKASAVVGAGALAGVAIPAVHAAGPEVIRVGLVGCGGRGSGAASDAMNAGKRLKLPVKLTALGDLYPDALKSARERLKQQGGEHYAVTEDMCFDGFDNYKHVIDNVDVVLLGTPPGFRPEHVRYAVEKNKHTFVEKPVATDAPGTRSILESAKLAEQKKLCMVSGLCWRYHPAMRDTIQQVLDGKIGDIKMIQGVYNTRRPKSYIPRAAGWTDMHFQVHNWYYYTWLSGDFNVEQHIHTLDKMAWAKGDVYPEKCWGMGGRAAIDPAEPGHIYDHHSVVYQWADGTLGYSFCRQMRGTTSDTSDLVVGTKGSANLMGFEISGENKWSLSSRERRGLNMYQEEHDELFAAIAAGKVISNGVYMANSTLMGIMGRMATYTGQVITWDQAMGDTTKLVPDKLEFGPLPEPKVAIPGTTEPA